MLTIFTKLMVNLVFKEIIMDNNVFKELREKKTKGKWEEPISQTALAKQMGIKQQTVSNAENGNNISYKTVKKYHEYFGVPYKTLFGESFAFEEENVDISNELRLSDEAINNIRKLSPEALTLLNAILSNEYVGMKLENNYKTLQSIKFYKSLKADVSTEKDIHMEKYILSESFTNFMINDVLPDMK